MTEMWTWKNCSNIFTFALLLCLLSLCPINAQTLVLPVSEDACARCCSLVDIWTTNEAAQLGCQQAGCRGSQVNLNETQAACKNLFTNNADGRNGCEVGRDFRFQGFSFVLKPDEQLFQCNQDGNLFPNEPLVGPKILTNEECIICCTELDNGFDLVSPDDFAAEHCRAACSDNFFCDDDPLHRNRLGCAIGISFLTEGKALLRETNRFFTCDANGLTLVTNSSTNTPTKSPTNVPTRSLTNSPTKLVTNAPTTSPLVATNSTAATVTPVADAGDSSIKISGVFVFISVLFAGVILGFVGFVFRLRRQAILLAKSDEGNISGFAAVKTAKKKGSEQQITISSSPKTAARNYTAPMYDSHIGTATMFNDGPVSEGANFSSTAIHSNGDGGRAAAISAPALVPYAPIPPPKIPIDQPRAPVSTLLLGHLSEASF